MVQSYWILNKRIYWKCNKFKNIFLGKLRYGLGMLESAQWVVGSYGGHFAIFGPKVQEILNFEQYVSLEIQ